MESIWWRKPWFFGLVLGLGLFLGGLLGTVARVHWEGDEFALDWPVLIGYFAGGFIGAYVTTHIGSRRKKGPK